MRYPRLYTNSIKYKIIFLILATWASFSEAALYPFGAPTSDSEIKFSSWETGTERIDLLSDVLLFGDGYVSSVWINSFGSISLNSTTEANIKNIRHNVIMAPFFSESAQGATGSVFFKQSLNDSELFANISRDINLLEDESEGAFYPTFALKVTWSNISSVNDTEKINTFQAILATNSTRTYLLFNFAPIQWTSANGRFAESGIYAAGNSFQFCSYFLPGSGTQQIRQLAIRSMIIGERGRHIIDVTDPLICTNFSSLCGACPSGGRGVFQGRFELPSDEEKGMNFFCNFTCKPDLVIKPNVTSQRVECSYDSDYYEFEWEETDPPSCVDLNHTFTFFTSMEVANDSLSFMSRDLLNDVNEQMISRLLENVNVTDVLVGMSPSRNSSDNNHTYIEFTTYVPPYTNRKLTNKTLAERLKFELNITSIIVEDKTDRCLQSCLCRNLKDQAKCKGKGKPLVPPDACCGKCGEPQKAYASSLKACCNHSILYDPRIAVCCNGRIRKGSACPT